MIYGTNPQTNSSTPIKMDIIVTERGGGKVCLDGFMYTVKYENQSKTETWRCVRRVTDSCHAILKTTNYEVSTLAKPHNHPSDKTAVEIEKCYDMKQQANTTNDRPNSRLHFDAGKHVLLVGMQLALFLLIMIPFHELVTLNSVHES